MNRSDSGVRLSKRIKLEDSTSDFRFSSRSITPRLSPKVASPPIHESYTPLFGKEIHYSQSDYLNSLDRYLRCLNWDARTRASFRKNVYTNLRPWKSFLGTSGDVIVAKWHPNGEHYALGSSTSEDASSEAHNRPLNLVYGNVVDNTLHELDDHCIYISDSLLLHNNRKYSTISDIAFHPNRNEFLTSAYDNTVKIWTIHDEDKPLCRDTIKFSSHAELLAVNDDGIAFAACQRDWNQGISVYNHWETSTSTELTDRRVEQNNLLPAALKFGHAGQSRNYLLAGFSQAQARNTNAEPIGLFTVWDLARSERLNDFTGCNQSVFDVAWRPSSEHFAVATNRSGLLVEKHRIGDVRSHIRTYTVKDNKKLQEFDCDAADINIVQFHPSDPNILVAAATNGTSYLWDRRRGDAPILKLQHGAATEDVDNVNTFDTGVKFLAFSSEGHSLYTGSSDGVLKHWNIYSAQEDCLVRNVATFPSGIMAGAFSPDFSNLIIGTVQGEVSVLTCAPPTMEEDSNKITCVRAHPVTDTHVSETLARDDAEALIDTGEVVMDPLYGPGQGPRATFFCKDARPKNAELVPESLLPEILSTQFDETLHKQGMRIMHCLHETGGVTPPSLKLELDSREGRKAIAREHYERRRRFDSQASQVLNRLIATGFDVRAKNMIQVDAMKKMLYEGHDYNDEDEWGNEDDDDDHDQY